MVIGIDGNEANIKERVGVNVWAIELLKQFKRMKDKGQGLKADIRFVVYLTQEPLADMPEETKDWQYRVIGPGKFWTRWRLPLDLYLHRPRPDVFLSLSHYSPKFAPIPRVVSIMDLSFLKFPAAFKPAVRWQLVNWTRESVNKAAHVVTISEFNKREIVKEYQYPAGNITVCYPGVSQMFKGLTFARKGQTLSKYKIQGKYLLFLGTLQPKKNLRRLLKAFKIVKKKFPDVELVVAGKIWSQFASMEIIDQAGVNYAGFVPDADLPDLMAAAEALVLPSLYEGFGIPAVEAMSVGTLVAASNRTSLPEVVGNAGLLFDPTDPRDIASTLVECLKMSSAKREMLKAAGRKRIENFSWEAAAKTTLNVLQSVQHV